MALVGGSGRSAGDGESWSGSAEKTKKAVDWNLRESSDGVPRRK